jgi:hypothetical protein
LDVAQQMAVALLAGQDVVPAADELRRRSPWLLVRWRLARFARVAGAGADWVAAWRTTRLFGPLPQWLLENAAARADVPGGFQLVADWAMEDLTQWQRRFDGWLMLGLTVVTGTLAGVTVVAIFQALVRLVAIVVEY